MALIFAEYTTGDKIGWSDESTIYVAKTPDGDPEKPLAIKVRSYLHEAEGVAILEAAEQQRKAAAAGCTFIAPIFSLGLVQHSCFYVTPRYPRSILSLIQGKVTVQPEGLLALNKRLLAALRELQSKLGRAHGNLKTSNILLTGTARLRDSGVFLSDVTAVPGKNFAADLNAIGRAVYELVRRREIHSFDWPIAHSSEWMNLGPSGPAWRDYCNALLDPALASAADPLGAAEQALAKIGRKAGPKIVWKPIAVGATLLALVAGAVVAGGPFLRHLRESRAANSAGNAETGDDAWVAALAEELDQDPAWKSDDAYVNDHLVSPLRELHLGKAEIAALRKDPSAPDGAGGRISTAVAALKSAFDSWDARTTVNQGYEDFASRGWTLPAGSIAKLRGSLSGSRPVLPQIAAVSHAAKVIPEIQLKWRLLQETFSRLEKSGEPVLAKTPAFVKSEAGEAPDLDHLLASLGAESDRLSHLLDLAASANHTRMQTEGKFAGFSGAVTDQTLREWEDDARRFQPAPEEIERLRAGWAKSFAELAAKIQVSPGDKPRLSAELNRAKSAADTSLNGLLAGDVARVDKAAQTDITNLDQQIAAPAVTAPAAQMPNPTASAPASPSLGPGDRQIFGQLVTQLQAVDFSSISPVAARGLRDKFLSDVKKGTSPSFSKEVGPFLDSLSALRFSEASAPVTGPAIPEWRGPVSSPSGIAYTWGEYRLDFTLIPADGEKGAFFLAADEMPVGLVIDWINKHGANWAAIEFHPQPARGPRAWESPHSGGMILKRDWLWPAMMGANFTFYPPGKTPPPPSPLTPFSYINDQTASLTAAQLGFRLPTAAEWGRGYRLAKANGWESGEANLRDASWEAQRKYIADFIHAAHGLLLNPPWPDGDIFIPSDLKSISHGEKAHPATSADDGHLWFTAVTQGGKPLNDLIGNVAEFVTENETPNGRFFVIGGSALSPAEVDPTTPYAVSLVQKPLGFSDVGFRLALSPARPAGAPGHSSDVEAFKRLIQNAPAQAR